jgi:hypothetical protein
MYMHCSNNKKAGGTWQLVFASNTDGRCSGEAGPASSQYESDCIWPPGRLSNSRIENSVLFSLYFFFFFFLVFTFWQGGFTKGARKEM